MPPVVVAVQVAVDAAQRNDVPEIVCGTGAIIVIICVAVLIQPPIVTEYVINEVPAAIPDTTPDVFIVAIEGFELVQEPPFDVPVKVDVSPAHKLTLPDIVCGIGSDIVIVCVAVLMQAPADTV